MLVFLGGIFLILKGAYMINPGLALLILGFGLVRWAVK